MSPTNSSLGMPSPSPSTVAGSTVGEPGGSLPCLPSSLWAAPRTKSRMEATEPFHWRGRTTRSEANAWLPPEAGGAMLWLHVVLPEDRVMVSVPKLTPLEVSARLLVQEVVAVPQLQ